MERSNKILTQLVELERSSQPLEVPNITVVLKLPNEFLGGAVFVSKLREQGKRLRDGKVNIHSSRTSEYFINSSQNGLATSFSIDRRSSLFPDSETTPELYSLIAQTGVELSFVSGESKLNNARKELKSGNGRPSLGYFGKYGDYSFGIDDENVKIQYDILKDEVELWIEGTPDERYIRKSGEINSYPDFSDSYMLLSVDYVMVPSLGGSAFPDLQSNRKSLTPTIMFIRTTGRDFTLRKFNEAVNLGGYRVFSAGPINAFSE